MKQYWRIWGTSSRIRAIRESGRAQSCTRKTFRPQDRQNLSSRIETILRFVFALTIFGALRFPSPVVPWLGGWPRPERAMGPIRWLGRRMENVVDCGKRNGLRHRYLRTNRAAVMNSTGGVSDWSGGARRVAVLWYLMLMSWETTQGKARPM